MTRGHPAEIQLLPSKDEDYVILLSDGEWSKAIKLVQDQPWSKKSIGWRGCQLASDRDE